MSLASFEVYLSDIDLLDLIAFFCQRSKTSVLHISDAQHVAAIYFAQGKIVHAICDGTLVEPALLKILKISGGKISSEDGVASKKNTLSLGIDDFLALNTEPATQVNSQDSAQLNINSENSPDLDLKAKLKQYLQSGYQAYLAADYPKAKEFWDEALKLDPFNARLKQNLSKINNLL